MPTTSTENDEFIEKYPVKTGTAEQFQENLFSQPASRSSQKVVNATGRLESRPPLHE